MTDGAAYTLREIKKDGAFWDKDLEEAYNRVTATDPTKFWTSG
jgi:hypothetical protein